MGLKKNNFHIQHESDVFQRCLVFPKDEIYMLQAFVYFIEINFLCVSLQYVPYFIEKKTSENWSLNIWFIDLRIKNKGKQEATLFERLL